MEEWGFRSSTILLVEDMDINREVMSELLMGVGLKVRLANNGVEALAEVSRQTPDLILMDCHMPVMDGYAATRQLRADPALANLPIVALTASAMADDKRRCLAAGMSAFVAKPLNLRDLYTEIALCLPELSACVTLPMTTQTFRNPVRDTLLPDFPGIDTSIGLAQVGGKAPLLLHVLKKFRDNLGQSFEPSFMAAMTAQTWDVAERLAHSLKGVSQTLGASDLAEATLALEIAVRERQPDRMALLFTAVSQRLWVVREGLKQIDSASVDITAALQSSTLTADDIAKLTRLSELLAQRDAEAAELAAELSSALASSSHRTTWRAMAAAVECVDFASAPRLLQPLRGVVSSKPSSTVNSP